MEKAKENSMVLGLEIQVKCSFCGGPLDRRGLKQIVHYCNKYCRKMHKRILRKKEKSNRKRIQL